MYSICTAVGTKNMQIYILTDSDMQRACQQTEKLNQRDRQLSERLAHQQDFTVSNEWVQIKLVDRRGGSITDFVDFGLVDKEAGWCGSRRAYWQACTKEAGRQNSRLRGRHQGRTVGKEAGWHSSRHKEQVSADTRSRQNSRLRGRLADQKAAKHAQRQAFKEGINNVQQILY